MRIFCLLQVIWLATCSGSRSRNWAHHGASMFADLTTVEMKAVRAYLHGIPDMKLTNARDGTLKKNSILLIELHVPKKVEALRALDNGQAKPPREARVVVQFGNQTKPNITEYIVSPMPYPNSHRVNHFKTGKPISFDSRPKTNVEDAHIYNFLQRAFAKANNFLLETTGGFSFTNCSKWCLTFIDVAPRGLGPGERRTWIMLHKSVDGFFLHPVGVEVLINHQDLDPNKWTVEKVWYNQMYFNGVDHLVEKYESGELEIVKLPNHNTDDLFSTYMPRGQSNTPTNIYGPKLVEPQGPRYRVDRNFVEYAGWSFAYRVSSSTGIQIFDLRFNRERIAYEISLQEAISFYSGDTPAGMQTKYIDSGWFMGSSSFELASGIDCPEIASFVDLYHYQDSDKPVRYRNALCIFEMTTAMPLRRHFDSNLRGSYNFYGGLENTVLVLRTTSTVYNYDYIWDFIFYQNGVVEAKISATGYIHGTFFTPNGLHYGTKVNQHLLGNLHTHLIHYKVDLDISGKYFGMIIFVIVTLKLSKRITAPRLWR